MNKKVLVKGYCNKFIGTILEELDEDLYRVLTGNEVQIWYESNYNLDGFGVCGIVEFNDFISIFTPFRKQRADHIKIFKDYMSVNIEFKIDNIIFPQIFLLAHNDERFSHLENIKQKNIETVFTSKGNFEVINKTVPPKFKIKNHFKVPISLYDTIDIDMKKAISI